MLRGFILILFLVGSTTGLTTSQRKRITKIVKDLKLTINGKSIKLDDNFFKGRGPIRDHLYEESLAKRALVWEQVAKLNDMIENANGETISRSASRDIEDVDGKFDDEIHDLQDIKDLIKFYENNPHYMDLDSKETKVARGAITTKYKPWKMPIKYKIRKRLNKDRTIKDRLVKAIDAWQKDTCVRFEQRSGTIKGPNIVFIKRKKGCSSRTGQRKVRQPIKLSRGCSRGNIIHEIGHALGFHHEHERYDRKVDVIKENIKVGKKRQFTRLKRGKADSFGFPYDFTSIMHYGQYAFSKDKNKKKTILTIPRSFGETIGQRDRLSFLDVKTANWLYCKKSCGGNSLVWSNCKNGGYRNPNKCQECLCPDGWGGKFCEQTARSLPTSASCGRTDLRPTLQRQTFTSPRYDNGGYNKNHECTWRIRSTPADRIRLRILNLKLKCDSPCRDYVEVRYLDTKAPGPRSSTRCHRLVWRRVYGKHYVISFLESRSVDVTSAFTFTQTVWRKIQKYGLSGNSNICQTLKENTNQAPSTMQKP